MMFDLNIFSAKVGTPGKNPNEAFSNLSSGVYTYEVRTEDGCIETGSIDIIDPIHCYFSTDQTIDLCQLMGK
jgi:hypothetical protein